MAESGMYTLLLADDEEVIRELILEGISEWNHRNPACGFTVIPANDGHEGISLFQANTQRVDAVLTDINMKPRSGVDLINYVHADRPEVVCFGMSAGLFALEDQVNSLRSDGTLKDLFNKPFSPFSALYDALDAIYNAIPQRE